MVQSKLTNAVTQRLIDDDDDPLVPLGKAFQEVIGEQFDYSTFWRWGQRGVLVNGQRVYLETTKIGQRRRTTVSAVRRFVAAMNPVPGPAKNEAETRANVDAGYAALRKRRPVRKHGQNTAG